ncbi:hypothetical protein CEK26_003013 [Fusarium fujikuroi]|nr:hypothetical protein CEK26_003013 [Fusarium fujikuroi]
MAELALAIASVAGTVDVCIKLGKYLVQAYKDYGQVDRLAEEVSVRIQVCWIRIASQLEIIKELESGMTDDQRELQSHILRILQSKLEAATVVISKPDKHGISKRYRALHFLNLRESLERTVADLESWQKRFEPSWFQILKTGPASIDNVLKSVNQSNTQGREEPAREGLKFRESFNNSETVKLAEKVLENLEIQAIPYCEAEIAVKQKDNKYFIIDTVSRDTVALRDARELASRLRDSNPSTFGTLKCKGVVQLTREPSLKFIFGVPDGYSRVRNCRELLLSGIAPESLTTRLNIARQLVTAVYYVHLYEFVHKNITPETILTLYCTSKGNEQMLVCLVGFQLFRYADAPTNTSKTEKRSLLYQHPTRIDAVSTNANMDGSLSDLVNDYRLTTHYEDGHTIHFHRDPDTPPSSPYRKEYWEKVRTLGHGGQGDILLQTCTAGGRTITDRAVKRIRLDSEHSKRYYKLELESIVKFSHEKYSQYFVKSLGWYTRSNKLYIAMEFFPDGDLYAYIRDHQRLTEEECSHITSQVISGIAIMHEEGFAHRDVKPQNILIYKTATSLDPRSWWVKLADFGISKKLTTETFGTTLVPGTPLFMAPELLHPDSESISTRNYQIGDTWAIGVTAFFILTKTLPFKSQLAVLHYTGSSDELAGSLAQCQITGKAQDFVHKLLNPRPGERLEAAEARQHDWIRPWLPEVPRSGAHSSLSTTSSRRSSVEGCKCATREISTLASHTLSERWTGDLHNPGVSPNSLHEIQNVSDILVGVEKSELPIVKAESIIITRSLDTNMLQQLHQYIVVGNVDMVRTIVSLGVDVNSPDSDGQTPLHLSINNGHLGITRLLCEAGAVIEGRNPSGHTPLQSAAKNDHTEMAKLLLEMGADIEAVGPPPSSGTIQMGPAYDGLLHHNGVNAKETAMSGGTPLTIAAREGNMDTSSLLIGKGASLEALDYLMRTPLMVAVNGRHTDVAKGLLDAGADINASDRQGFTPLIIAAEHGNAETVRLLLRRRAHLHSKSLPARAALIEAAKRGHGAVVEVLLRWGATLETMDFSGETALVNAVRGNHKGVVALLLQRGANVKAVDRHRVACLKIAKDNCNLAIMCLLIEHGARESWFFSY